MNLITLTIKEIHQGLKDKKFSALELTNAYLYKIKQNDKDIFAYLSVSKQLALKQAKEVDDLISRDEELPLLAGVPCAIKDNMMIEGEQCTAGSKILENYVALYDAGAISRGAYF
jgi:aspartyl-tRNA(Asn)/glutamyl-tRNA(Gln) amidotransferase subunit A